MNRRSSSSDQCSDACAGRFGDVWERARPLAFSADPHAPRAPGPPPEKVVWMGLGGVSHLLRIWLEHVGALGCY